MFAKKEKKLERLSLEWFMSNWDLDGVFAWEINREDFKRLHNIYHLTFSCSCVPKSTSYLLGKPIRLKPDGDISAIMFDYCPDCKSYLKE